LWPIG